MCKTIKQKVKFKAPPEVIYKLLTDSRLNSRFTGDRSKISKHVGGRFSIFSGHLTGINVDLCPSKRVVQAWRSDDFPVGVFSMATFVLTRTKGGGTELVLTHRGVPKEIIPRTERDWKRYYWNRMKDFLSENFEGHQTRRLSP